jgi:hypothetical protein
MMKHVLLAASAVVAIAAAAPQPSPSPSPAVPSALTIFEAAQSVARNNPDPPYMSYQMHEIFVHHGKPFTFDYRVWYRSDGKGLMQDLAADRRGGHEPRFGYPFPVAPDDNILLYATPAPRATVPPPLGGSPVPSGQPTPPVLAVESVTKDRFYDVRFIGVEDLDGHLTYHLGMSSHDPTDRDHPWKDMWVDTTTFEVWKAHAAGSGSKGPATGSIDADVWFGQVGDYWLITHAQGDGEVRLAFISDSGHYEYYFSGFGFPNTIPDWYFDPSTFAHH